jgi:hypothetical protein
MEQREERNRQVEATVKVKEPTRVEALTCFRENANKSKRGTHGQNPVNGPLEAYFFETSPICLATGKTFV